MASSGHGAEPVQLELQIGRESRFLIWYNLPDDGYWPLLFKLLGRLLQSRTRRILIDRVLRTVEDGRPVFWFKCRNVTEALILRGILHGRLLDAGPQAYSFLQLDFVSGQTYSTRDRLYKDAWTPQDGLLIEAGIAQPTLRDRQLVPPHLLYVRLEPMPLSELERSLPPPAVPEQPRTAARPPRAPPTSPGRFATRRQKRKAARNLGPYAS